MEEPSFLRRAVYAPPISMMPINGLSLLHLTWYPGGGSTSLHKVIKSERMTKRRRVFIELAENLPKVSRPLVPQCQYYLGP